MVALALNSKSEQLSALLELICEDLQLNDTQYERARRAYKAIYEWLCDTSSPVSKFDPLVYAQGSMALGTTVKPRDGEEFDVDLICLLRGLFGRRPSRKEVLALIGDRLRAHGTYGPMIEVRDRCVRLRYEGDFHADIVPAIPSPLSCTWGETGIVIPCRKEEAWISTNPKGYGAWFFSRCEERILLERRAMLEPFPKPVDAEDKASLQRQTQLFKRRCAVQFEDDCTYAPKSILLTTLCGLLANGERLLYDAINQTLDRLIGAYALTNDSMPPRVLNPSNPDENIARHWEKDQRHFESFKNYILTFKSKMKALGSAEGTVAIAKVLKDLFDPGDRGIVNRAVEQYTERFQGSRMTGDIRIAPRTSVLTTAASGLTFAGNSFFGN